MNFTHDEIAAIIGMKELERIAAVREVQQLSAVWSNLEALRQRVKELENGLSANADSSGATVTPIKS